jgi:hypothetical protein
MEKKAGRPRVIPDQLVPKVLELYNEGLGYRRISRELGKRYGLAVDWSTIRGYIKSLAKKKT